MKLLLTIMFTTGICLAQSDGDDLITVPKKYVSPSGIAQASVSSSADSVHGYVGIGHEVGTAMKEGLGAFTDETQRFAQTTPGKFTMFIIAYKTIGKDLVRFVFALLLVPIGITVWLKSYLNDCFPTKYVSNETFTPEGKLSSRSYALNKQTTCDSQVQFVYFIVIMLFLVFCVLIAFV